MKQKPICGIYKISCMDTGKMYIGSSANVHTRWKSHIKLLRHGNSHSPHLQHAWDKYGEDRFLFEVVEIVEPDVLLEREQYWLDLYQSYDDTRGYNISRSASAPMAGRKHSEVTKSRFSSTRMGADNGNWKPSLICKNCGKEFKNKRGKKKPQEFCSIVCYWIYWPKHLTEDRRIAQGNSNRGKTVPRDVVEKSALSRSATYLVTTPEGDTFEITGLAKFCRERGLDQGSMSKVSLGQRESYKGWKCKRV